MPWRHPLNPIDDARYQAFVQGLDVPPAAVAERLAAAGIEEPPLGLRWGFRRQVGIRLSRTYAKLALHPLSVALLRHEADCLARLPAPPGYRVPSLQHFHDGGDWAVSVTGMEAGAPPASWRALLGRAGPFEAAAAADRPLADHLAPLATTPRLTRWSERLQRRYSAERLVPIGGSHGDFVYWNLLQTSTGSPVLLDFDYFRPDRSRQHDRCFWTWAPLAAKAVAWGRERWLAAASPVLARGEGSLAMALMLVEHGALMEQEHALPDIGMLYGAADLSVRLRLLDLYDAAVTRLAGS
jgi:hypothetical protein